MSLPTKLFETEHFSTWRQLEVVDSHTCGQPTRVILGGAGIAPGMTPRDAQSYLEDSAPWVRRAAILEPRGHRSMFGAAAIAPPASQPWGVVFMDANGYPEMCGHATIGIATTLCELGLVQPSGDHDGQNGSFSFGLESPAGRLNLEAVIVNGRCESVSFQTPLAHFVGSVDITLDTGVFAQVDVAYGGQYYAFIPSVAAGLDIVPDSIDGLISAAMSVRDELARQFSITDKSTGKVPEIGNILWTQESHSKDADARNVPISKAGSFDRSPCGTATCARMAVLVAKGKLSVGETFVNESILGTLYRGHVTAMHPHVPNGIIPRVSGSAWLTARSCLFVDPRDPLGAGYLVGGGVAVL
ncbi:hypothetical protein PFICI_00084 [Pestalotiopsis fici W106-1]|uniref:trans-L-3-hydroxyproline dehydratase n=1 Tax=Pestalotiopsis fici (strain W106-1 / CGMCC3.15140) TaxID=1229662 RepID=W3XLY4_PESFW|nr:uncharacterized protein PFICI_00084 [Pestalotiopsis fici W106-1]ETS86256.1 hypothetical protein PFICI_00084 [Pestalotiopsis fici W106-1]